MATESVILNTAKKGGRAKFAYELSREFDDETTVIYPKSGAYVENDCVILDFHSVSKVFTTCYSLYKLFINKKVLYVTSLHPLTFVFMLIFKGERVLICHDPVHSFDKKVFEKGNFLSIISIISSRLSERLADRLILLNQSDYEKYKKRYLGKQVVEGFHPVFNAEVVGDLVRKYDIGFFGRISEHKGMDQFVEISNKLSDKMEITGIIVGQGVVPLDIRIPENVHLINEWVTDEKLVEAISNTKVCILPYVAATQSGIVSLCLSIGTPVIVPNVGGLGSQVQDRITGYVVEENKVENFVEAALVLLNNFSEYEKIVGNQIKQKGKYNWHNLYRKIVSNES